MTIDLTAKAGEPMWSLEDGELYILNGRFYRARHLGYKEHGAVVIFALHEECDPFVVLDPDQVAAARA